RDLLDCISRERDNLINQDIKGIWSSLEEKSEIMESITRTNEHLESILGKTPIYNDIPPRDRQTVMELSSSLDDLKKEIKLRVRENISFINDTLDFFHEMISTMTMSGHRENSYGPAGNSRKGSNSLIYHGEV
ncbi:flagellar protein FlgN, partial [Deltaproteobacteria bacterium]|nr:flagellar protein FlgN [Deltaproteobacteria bacterium]